MSADVPTPDEFRTQEVQIRESSRQDNSERPNVVIFHDSLMNTIKDTMMIKEKVDITKIWSPTLEETQAKIDEIDPTDRIVIQGITRQVADFSPDDLASLVFDTVEKCLTKAEKVLVSLIVDREDDPEYRAKTEATKSRP